MDPWGNLGLNVITRIGFWGIWYYNYNKEPPPKIVLVTFLGPYNRVSVWLAQLQLTNVWQICFRIWLSAAHLNISKGLTSHFWTCNHVAHYKRMLCSSPCPSTLNEGDFPCLVKPPLETHGEIGTFWYFNPSILWDLRRIYLEPKLEYSCFVYPTSSCWEP